MQSKIIVIGAGQAGAQVCQTLRQKGFEGAIRLIGEEPHGPYQRPPLSKKYLMGEAVQDALYLRPDAFYETNNIELTTGITVTAIDLDNKKVELSSGETDNYDKLILTTGTSARALRIPGAHLNGVVSLRSMSDVDAMKDQFRVGAHLVIIGGGYIGLEVAAVAKSLGLKVTILEAQERLLKRVVAPDTGSFFHQLHEGNGVELQCQAMAVEIRGVGKAEEVILSDGSVIRCDFVLSAIGAAPNDGLAAQAGLDVDDGILVDGEGKTSDENVFAAGDCVRFYSERYGRSIRLESVQNAIDQSKAVAAAIIGEDVNYDPLPWFWSDQYDIKLQIAGLSDGYDKSITCGDPSSNSFYVAYLSNGKLLAVDSINHPRSHMMARRKIGEQWSEDLLPAAK